MKKVWNCFIGCFLVVVLLLTQSLSAFALTGADITNLTVYSTDATSTKLSCNINAAVSAVVWYGTAPDMLSSSQDLFVLNDYASLWGVKLTGLNPGTTYYFQITATDAGGSSACSEVQQFTTTSDVLQITNVRAYSTGETFSKFDWSTTKDAVCTLWYTGSTAPFVSSPRTSGLGTFHLDFLNSLTPNTTYYYKIVAEDADHNVVTSDIYVHYPACIYTTAGNRGEDLSA